MTDALIISNDYFLAVAHLTIAFQAIKSFDLREPWDHLQVYFMSLLQLIIASELTYSLAYGALFVFFLIAFVNAIIFAHFMKEGITVKAGTKKAHSIHLPADARDYRSLFCFVAESARGIVGKGLCKKHQNGRLFG